jgi:alkanesulfonate monooxygenase SsuD/methylene tetrahydromethanopterin reductase-like flavin-dependent oxidoreductase (luciferase family)
VPEIWTTSRPSELRGTRAPAGAFLGTPGPDQGFALKLARRFEDRLILGSGEQPEDAMVGCTAVAMRRAASFGRAPVIHDLTLAFTLWGFLPGAPADLVAAREPLFRSASHHYQAQRIIADCVHESTLRLTPLQVAEQIQDWRSLLELPIQE